MRKHDLITLTITTLIAIITLVATITFITLVANNNSESVDSLIEVLGTVG